MLIGTLDVFYAYPNLRPRWYREFPDALAGLAGGHSWDA